MLGESAIFRFENSHPSPQMCSNSAIVHGILALRLVPIGHVRTGVGNVVEVDEDLKRSRTICANKIKEAVHDGDEDGRTF